jgi:hypothetical protein
LGRAATLPWAQSTIRGSSPGNRLLQFDHYIVNLSMGFGILLAALALGAGKPKGVQTITYRSLNTTAIRPATTTVVLSGASIMNLSCIPGRPLSKANVTIQFSDEVRILGLDPCPGWQVDVGQHIQVLELEYLTTSAITGTFMTGGSALTTIVLPVKPGLTISKGAFADCGVLTTLQFRMATAEYDTAFLNIEDGAFRAGSKFLPVGKGAVGIAFKAAPAAQASESDCLRLLPLANRPGGVLLVSSSVPKSEVFKSITSIDVGWREYMYNVMMGVKVGTFSVSPRSDARQSVPLFLMLDRTFVRDPASAALDESLTGLVQRMGETAGTTLVDLGIASTRSQVDAGATIQTLLIDFYITTEQALHTLAGNGTYGLVLNAPLSDRSRRWILNLLFETGFVEAQVSFLSAKFEPGAIEEAQLALRQAEAGFVTQNSFHPDRALLRSISVRIEDLVRGSRRTAAAVATTVIAQSYNATVASRQTDAVPWVVSLVNDSGDVIYGLHIGMKVGGQNVGCVARLFKHVDAVTTEAFRRDGCRGLGRRRGLAQTDGRVDVVRENVAHPRLGGEDIPSEGG